MLVRKLDEKDLFPFGGIEDVDGPDGPGVYGGDILVEYPSGRVVEAVILAGKDGNGEYVNAVIFADPLDPPNQVELVRFGRATKVVERASELKAMKKVKLLDLGRLGFEQR